MSRDSNAFKDLLEIKASVDIARTRDAQEKQLKVLESKVRKEEIEKLKSEIEAHGQSIIDRENAERVSQLAAIEKIHELGLKIHHDQLKRVEEFSLKYSISLKQAAEKFRQHVIDNGADFCLVENREKMDAALGALANQYNLTPKDVQSELKTMIEYGGEGPLQKRLESAVAKKKKNAEEEAALKTKAEAEKEKQESEKLHPFVIYVIGPLAFTAVWWLKPFFKMVFSLIHH